MEPATIALSALSLGGLGFTFGALIALAHAKLRVWEDPRIDGVTERLPGSNCGACGFAGCRSFAEGLVAGTTQPASCTNMGTEQISDVADYLGVAAGEAVKRVARLLCAGGASVAAQRAEYRGQRNCGSAARVASGGKACSWGCLGLGDCQVACTFEAIHMNAQALPVVDPERCTACGDCVEACPKDLFEVMPADRKLLVQCKNELEGEEAEAICRVACTGCGKCALDAAPGLIEIVRGLAVIDYGANEKATPEATRRCPTGAITWVEGAQDLEGREAGVDEAVAGMVEAVESPGRVG